MFRRFTTVPAAHQAGTALNLPVPYQRNPKSDTRTLLVFDSYHSTDRQKEKFLTGLIYDFLKIVDQEAKKETKQSVFSHDLFTIYLNYLSDPNSSGDDDDDEPEEQADGSIRQLTFSQINRKRVLDFFLKVKPTRIVTLGRKSFEIFSAFYEQEFLKKATWTNLLGVPFPIQFQEHKSTLIPVLNPNWLCTYKDSRDPYVIGYFIRTWKTVQTGVHYNNINLRPDQIKIQVVDSTKRFDRMMDYVEAAEYVAIDTETDNLNRIVNRIVIIQFAITPTTGFVLPLFHYETPFSKKELDYIKDRLASYFGQKLNDTHIYCNAEFDLPVIRTAFSVPFYPTPVWDIQAGEFCLDENMHELKSVAGDTHGYHSLGNLSVQYGFTGYLSGSFGKEDRAGIANLPLSTPGLIEYCAYDVAVLIGIYRQQLVQGQAKKHDRYPQIVKHLVGDTIHTFATMNINGVLVDKQHLWSLSSIDSPVEKLLVDMQREILETSYVKQAEKLIRKELKMPEYGLFGAVESKLFSLRKNRHKQILFFDVVGLKPLSHGANGPSLDAKFQEEYKNVPIVEAFTNLSKAQKLRQAFILPLTKYLSHNEDAKKDGRIRPVFNYLRVVTGRTSACLVGDSLVATVDRSKSKVKLTSDPCIKYVPIKDIVPGTLVYTYDHDLKLTTQTVSWAGLTKTADTIVIVFQVGDELHKLRCTPDHKIRLASGQYKQAQHLMIGEQVLAFNGSATVLSIVQGLVEAVYDITVPLHHNFIAQGICVHNSKPNLQQIPSRGKLSKYIKRIFIAAPGTIFIKADFSAHEVRGWALISGDKDVSRAFQNGLDLYDNYIKNPTKENKERFKKEGDIHRINSSYFFGLKIEKVTDEIRQAVKGVTFGLIYGRSANSLAIQLGKTIEEVNEIIDKFFKRFSKAANWLLQIEKFARKHYYVEAITGLRRHLWPYLLPKTHDKEKMWKRLAAACDRRARNCISGDSVINTSLGLLPIKQLVGTKFKVLVADGSMQENKGCVCRGLKPVVKVTLHDGTVLKGTPDHEVYVLTKSMKYKKVRLDSLEGQFVVKIPPETLSLTRKRKQVATGYSAYPWLDLKFARLLGHLFAEGSVSGNSVTYANNDEEVMSDYLRLVRTLLGIKPKKWTNNMGNKAASFNDKAFAAYLVRIGIGKKQPERLVPRFMYRASEKMVANFLRAVFEGDGYNRGKGIGIEITTEKGIQGLKQLLQSLGIHTSYAVRDWESPEKRAFQLERKAQGDYYHLRNTHILAIYGKDLDIYGEKIGFISSRKQALLERNLGKLRYESAHETLPYLNEFVSQAYANCASLPGGVLKFKGQLVRLYKNVKSARVKLHKPGFLPSMRVIYGETFASNLEKLKSCHHEYIKCVSVEPHGYEVVYDILSVNHFKHFVANGVLTGNSPVQGAGSGIGYSAARLVESWTAKRFADYAEKFKRLPIRNQNMVHDSMEYEVDIPYIGYALEMIEYALTRGVEKKCAKLYGMKFPVGLSIDMEIGASLDSMQKWDGSVQELYRILIDTFKFQQEQLGYDVDVMDSVQTVFDEYLPPTLQEQIKNGYFQPQD